MRRGFATLALGVLVVGCAMVDQEPAPGLATPMTAGVGYTADCLPYEDADSVADYNAVSQLRTHDAFLGADVGASTRLSDGRRVWVFGDTLRGARFNGPRWVHNSMVLLGAGCAGVVLPPDRGAVIPDRADGTGYWPLSLLSRPVPGGDELVVSAVRVRGGALGVPIRTLGGAMARFAVPAHGSPRLLGVVDLGPDRPDTAVTWGAALVAAPDGGVLVYGTRWTGGDLVFGRELLLARTDWQHLTDPGRWRYWTGSRWASGPGRAAVLIRAVGGVCQALSVFRSGDRWIAVSKRDDYLGDTVGVWSAPAPTGPFRAAPDGVPVPSDLKRGVVVYLALAHPELPAPAGQVIVSVCVNTLDPARVLADPSAYRPYFVAVPLPR